MYNWFECKIKYEKVCEDGVERTVTESYLVDAVSFTEAEARIVEEMKQYVSGGFSVANISRKKFAETLLSKDGDKYYNARLAYITLNEKTGGEKLQNVNFLVRAEDIDGALDTVRAEMRKTMIDYSITGISETAIVDVLPYKI